MKDVNKPTAWSYIGNSTLFLMVTAVDVEREALNGKLTPITSQELFRCLDGGHTYYIGKLGAYPIIHVQCGQMGTSARDGAINTVKDAILAWRPDAVIMTGIAFGLKQQEQRMADVLVSSTLCSYESVKLRDSDGGYLIGEVPPAGRLLLNRFANCAIPPDAEFQRHVGRILCGSKVIDSKDFRDTLAGNHPDAIGGDMESYGVYSASASENISEWIIVKGISDWAYGKSEDKEMRQQKAAAAAVLLCQSALSSQDAFQHLPCNPLRNEVIERDGGRPDHTTVKFSMSLVLLAMEDLNFMLDSEKNLLDSADADGQPDLSSLLPQALTMVKKYSRFDQQAKLTDRAIRTAIKRMTTPGNIVPLTTLEALYGEPLRHRDYVVQMGLWLYELFKADSGYTEGEKRDAVRALIEFRRSYKQMLYARIVHVLAGVEDDDKREFFMGMQELSSFRDFLDPSQPRPEPNEAALTAADRRLKSAGDHLSSLGFVMKKRKPIQMETARSNSTQIWEKMEHIFRLTDMRNSCQDEALDAVLHYLEYPSDESRTRADAVCGSTAAEILRIRPPFTDLNQEEYDYLLDRKINPADYCVPLRFFLDNTMACVQELFNIKAQISVPNTMDTLRTIYRSARLSANQDRLTECLALNQFALESHLPEEDKVCLRKMMESLKTFPRIVWEDNLPTLNGLIEAAFRLYEEIVSRLAEDTGLSFSDLIQFREEQVEKLMATGIAREHAVELIQRLNYNTNLESGMELLRREQTIDNIDISNLNAKPLNQLRQEENKADDPKAPNSGELEQKPL